MSVFFKDYGIKVTAEFRIGPEVTCLATALKCPDGWIIDEIYTEPPWRKRGHARAVIERIKEVTGQPVRTHTILDSAKDFWEKMTTLGLHQPTERSAHEPG